MFIIKGKYQGRTEEIDSADTKSEADTLLGEYRLAFGPDWTLWVGEQSEPASLEPETENPSVKPARL